MRAAVNETDTNPYPCTILVCSRGGEHGESKTEELWRNHRRKVSDVWGGQVHSQKGVPGTPTKKAVEES